MFFDSVKAAYESGEVQIGLPPLGHGSCVTIVANGFTRFKAVFLTAAERQKLAELSKNDAKTFKSKG